LLIGRIKRLPFAAICLLLIIPLMEVDSQQRIESQFRIARLKYSGGGDWYNGSTEEVNLLKFIQKNTNIDCDRVMSLSIVRTIKCSAILSCS